MEAWKPVVGFEGRYEVSDLGNVRTLAYRGHPGVVRVLRPGTARGYRVVTFCVNRVMHRRYVHRLVLETFVGPQPDEHEAGHLNGRRDDNHLENLCWVTRQENAQHKRDHGTMPRVVSDADVIEIRRLRRTGMSYRAIGERFNYSPGNVHAIVNGRIYAHIVG